MMEKVKLLLLTLLPVLLLGCNKTDKKGSSDMMPMEDSVSYFAPVDDEFALQSVHRMEDNETYPYRIELIHEHLDSFLKREIIDENLEPYREMVENKFYILDVHYVMAGGVCFKIIFPNHPHAEFVAVTGIDVDDNDSITAYHLLDIKRKGK